MNRIRELRETRGWTQAQLGKRIGVAKTTITGYEREDRQPTPATICALCDLFDCSADYLLGRSNHVKPPELSGEDTELLRAYHDADPDLQGLIRRSLGVQDARSKPA